MNTDRSRLTEEVIQEAKKYLSGDAVKTITTATGLVGLSMEAPSKKLFPVLTPLRNRIPRVTHQGQGAVATNWKAVTGINTANLKVGATFGTRNPEISYAMQSRTATFKSWGLDDSVQDEAQWAGRGFEDVRAFASMALLRAVMIGEEDLLLGGMESAAGASFGTTGLGTPGTPAAVVGTGGSISAGTYVVNVMALPYYGARFAALGTGADAVPYHSAVSPKSANCVTSSGTQTINASVAHVPGAYAYAWFVEAGTTGTAGKLEAITFINSIKLTSLMGNKVPLTTLATTADNCCDAKDYDGMLTQVWGGTTVTVQRALSAGTLKTTASGAPVIVMDTGTAGVGVGLTADNAGGIVEIDEVLSYLWDVLKLGPQRILCSGQEAAKITTKIGASSGLGFQVAIGDGAANVIGGIRLTGYLNKFTGEQIAIEVHPSMPKGTILFETDDIPYPSTEIPRTLEVELLQEYALFEWARTQRKYEFGIYGNGVLKHYFPASFGLITNIANV